MPREFVTRRRVSFAETDMAGVMHFANYFRWMEDAEHAFWRSLGMSVHYPMGDVEISWPRVSTSCEYFAPSRFEDELEIRLRIVKVGRRSLEIEVDFHREGQRVAAGRTKAACCEVGRATFRSVEIPEELRAALEEG